jgi:Uma2 family endonuclease
MALTQPYSPDTPQTMRTSRGEVPVPEQMTLAEFERLDWPEDDRWELIEGVPCMTPSGNFEHQELAGLLLDCLRAKLVARGFRAVADIDVVFPGQESYLRPDISVFAPDRVPHPTSLPVRELPALVVELLSRSTAANDLGPKLAIYERAGVGEYWVANPATGSLGIFTRGDDGVYVEMHADSQGRVPSKLLATSLRIVRDNHTFRIAE